MREEKMREIKLDEKFLQSYVYGKHGNFFVSTGYRQSSAMTESPSWYYETFAWKLDENDKRTEWVADHSGAKYQDAAYKQHIEVVKQLHEKGEFREEDYSNEK